MALAARQASRSEPHAITTAAPSFEIPLIDGGATDRDVILAKEEGEGIRTSDEQMDSTVVPWAFLRARRESPLKGALGRGYNVALLIRFGTMFKQKTLFVLGAGASAEAGLPVGANLAKQISRLLRVDPNSSENPEGERLLAKLYERYPLHNNGYHLAAQAISEGVRLANSVDDYLDRHNQDQAIQRVGKAAIVKSILAAERESCLVRTLRSETSITELDDTWYLKFFRMLSARVKLSNARQIFDNVSFIVFNYDRCLEHFLVNALQLGYKMGPDDAVATLFDCHIIHTVLLGLLIEVKRTAMLRRGNACF
jgi:hypothetical protein